VIRSTSPPDSKAYLVDPDLADSPCGILIGETTLRHLDHQFQIKRVGEANLKGKDEKVTIYRVVGRNEGELGAKRLESLAATE
jgi:class 3 adenylate cyclase